MLNIDLFIALGVRNGDGDFPSFGVHLLAAEVIRPVRAPGYFDAAIRRASPGICCRRS